VDETDPAGAVLVGAAVEGHRDVVALEGEAGFVLVAGLAGGEVDVDGVPAGPAVRAAGEEDIVEYGLRLPDFAVAFVGDHDVVAVGVDAPVTIVDARRVGPVDGHRKASAVGARSVVDLVPVDLTVGSADPALADLEEGVVGAGVDTPGGEDRPSGDDGVVGVVVRVPARPLGRERGAVGEDDVAPQPDTVDHVAARDETGEDEVAGQHPVVFPDHMDASLAGDDAGLARVAHLDRRSELRLVEAFGRTEAVPAVGRPTVEQPPWLGIEIVIDGVDVPVVHLGVGLFGFHASVRQLTGGEVLTGIRRMQISEC
jgi:hypothetical protein